MAEETKPQQNGEESQQVTSPNPPQLPELSEVDMLTGKISELENSVNSYKDQLLRKAAEFENYKKRIESDYASMIKFANEELIVRLLPVLDDFERSLKARSAADPTGTANQDAFMKGMDLIYNKLKRVLESQGVKHLDVVGKPFDPQLHDALMQVQRSDVPPNTVLEEIDKGYTMHDKVIRHARVIVSAEPQDGQLHASESIGKTDTE